MNAIETNRWAVFFLRPSLVVALLPTRPQAAFMLEGQQYKTAYESELAATYDRLVTSDGSLVGLMIWPVAANTEGLFEALPEWSYIVAHPRTHFELVFSPPLNPEAVSAGDQSLVGQIYRSTSGEFAIAVDLAELTVSPGELRDIRLTGPVT